MTGRAATVRSVVGEAVFFVGVCVGIPLILFEYLSVTLGGSILGLLA